MPILSYILAIAEDCPFRDEPEATRLLRTVMVLILSIHFLSFLYTYIWFIIRISVVNEVREGGGKKGEGRRREERKERRGRGVESVRCEYNREYIQS